MNKRFIKVTKTKWDTISNKSQYNDSIVFIDGEGTSPNQIYTNGKIYANDAQGGGGGGQGVTYTAGENINIDTSTNTISATGYTYDVNGTFVEGPVTNHTIDNLIIGHVEGMNHTVGDASYMHVEGGYHTLLGANYAHAEGMYNTDESLYSHIEGSNNVIAANSQSAHVEGEGNHVEGFSSHAEGYYTRATNKYAHVGGYYTAVDGINECAIGRYNYLENRSASFKNKWSTGLVGLYIGNGSSESQRSNAFKFLFNGKAATCKGGKWATSGADYAEMFEWKDGNPDKEDRIGYFVSLDKDKIVKSGSYTKVIGVISGTAGVLGDEPMDWYNKYMTDEWGRVIYEDQEVEHTILVPTKNPDGTIEKKEQIVKEKIKTMKINPNYDPTQKYIPRTERPEWSIVGLFGKLLIRQDGTLTAGGYCKSNDNGIATAADDGFYVIEVINNNQARILLR